MKYLFSLLLIGMSFITVAQTKVEMRKSFEHFTPEQNAELQTKRLALALELTPTQQKQVLKINQKRAVELKKHVEFIKSKKDSELKMSSDERFKMINKRLDQMLAMQNEMKNILSDDQYEQWKNMQNQKKVAFKKGRKQSIERKRK